MTCHLGATRVHIHPLLPLLWIFALVSGSGPILPMLLALALHESGHLLAARWLRVPVEEIEITPLGGVITLRDMNSLPPAPAFFTAAAGPVCSFLGCMLAAALLRLGVVHFAFAQSFARGNLLLLLINLLPVLPLDGGRMLRACLSRFLPVAAANRVLTVAGYAVGAALCGLSLALALQGDIILSPAFAGLYLIYAAALESRQAASRYITALIGRRQRLERQEVLPVELLAAGAGTPARQLLGRLSPGKYHMIYVLSPDGLHPSGLVDEKMFCDAVLRQGNVLLGDCVKK